VTFAGRRPDHRAGSKLAAIDVHRAAEAAPDVKRGLDDGVAREGRRDRFGPSLQALTVSHALRVQPAASR
jgi:hypothetical protein